MEAGWTAVVGGEPLTSTDTDEFGDKQKIGKKACSVSLIMLDISREKLNK